MFIVVSSTSKFEIPVGRRVLLRHGNEREYEVFGMEYYIRFVFANDTMGHRNGWLFPWYYTYICNEQFMPVHRVLPSSCAQILWWTERYRSDSTESNISEQVGGICC